MASGGITHPRSWGPGVTGRSLGARGADVPLWPRHAHHAGVALPSRGSRVARNARLTVMSFITLVSGVALHEGDSVCY